MLLAALLGLTLALEVSASPTSSPTTPPVQESWAAFLRDTGQRPATIVVNLGFAALAPDKANPMLLEVKVRIPRPNEHGFPSRADSEAFEPVEDEIISRIERDAHAHHVGRLTTDGEWHVFFYAPSATGFEQAVGNLRARFDAYAIHGASQDDAQWQTYLGTLHPSPAEFQSILNARVIAHLQESGDKLTKPRRIDHWLYFPTDDSRARFLARLDAKRFKVEDQSKLDDPKGPNAFRLQLSHVGTPDAASIDPITVQLSDQAREAGGEYDGWETSIER